MKRVSEVFTRLKMQAKRLTIHPHLKVLYGLDGPFIDVESLFDA
jgi:hypothetical protein